LFSDDQIFEDALWQLGKRFISESEDREGPFSRLGLGRVTLP
jgi:hypothetical protein